MRKLTPRERAGIGPSALKQPGSVEWCWQTLDVFKRAFEILDVDWASVRKYHAEIVQHRAWRVVPPPPDGPYGSLDAMLRAEIGISEREFRARLRTAEEKATHALRLHGNGRPSDEARRDNFDYVKDNAGGNSSEYLTARIARDHPDILDRMKAGEFKSVRQAAIAAGITKVPTGLDALRRAWGKATQDERGQFMYEVTRFD